jgi:hypothetical protein
LDSSGVKLLELELTQNPALRARLELLQSLHADLQMGKMEQPSRNFTQQVMSRLDQYPLKSLSIRNGILLLIGVLVAALLAAFLVSSGVFDHATTTIDLNQVSLPDQYLPQTLPSFRFDGKLIVNTIIVLNLVLAWLVLDRAVLKPYFKRRMMTGH